MSATDSLELERSPELYLPRPPDDTEKYRYFGPPRRLVFAWLLIASAGVLYGYVHVAARAWLVSPLMWLLLMVMVPPVVVNFWLRAGRPRLTLTEHQAYLDGKYAGMLKTSFTVENMIRTIGKVTIADTGKFLRYDGVAEAW